MKPRMLMINRKVSWIKKPVLTMIFIVLIWIVLFIPGYAQFYEKPIGDGAGLPYFNVEYFRTFAVDKASALTGEKLNRLYVYYEILNDNLTFVKTDTSGFKANFEIMIAIYDDDENLIISKSLYKEVYENDFRETNSRDKKIVFKNHYDLPVGKFLIKIKLNDLISNKNTTQQLELELEDYLSKNIAISDLLFTENINTPEDTIDLSKWINPTVNNNFPALQGPLYIYFELYTKNAEDEVTINYLLKNVKEKTELDTVITKKIKSPFTSHLFKINKERLKGNKYSCIVTVKDKKNKVQRKDNFSFFWVKIPQVGNDLSTALEQMVYILPSDSLDKYDDADPEEQKEFFLSFWKERDPNPQTQNNELMEEYFRRVNYANRQFTALNLAGWRTDRGRILIKFGMPDDIERHPFEVYSVPYEIWRYYGLRRIFLFIDQSGFGDYRLSPDYMDQEYR
jgi:GWxTD domain-containing protein